MKSIATIISKKLFAWPLLATPALYMFMQYQSGSLGAWEYSDIQSISLQSSFEHLDLSLSCLLLGCVDLAKEARADQPCQQADDHDYNQHLQQGKACLTASSVRNNTRNAGRGSTFNGLIN